MGRGLEMSKARSPRSRGVGDAQVKWLRLRTPTGKEALLENSFRRDVSVRGTDQWRLRGLLVQYGNS